MSIGKLLNAAKVIAGALLVVLLVVYLKDYREKALTEMAEDAASAMAEG